MSRRRFKVLAELGKGGFGRVFHVVEEGSDMAPHLALKLLTGLWPADADPARRLRDEARVLARLRHPGIVRLYSMIELDAGPGLLLELVEGPNLAQTLRLGGPVPTRAALEIVAAVAEALVYALALPGPEGAPLGLLHRDIKPANIAVTRHGEVKLLDFGIAWADLAAREAQSGPEPRGTVTYMPPERHRGQDSATVDVYALGLVLANLLTGQEHPELPIGPGDQARFQGALGASVLSALGPASRAGSVIGGLVLSCVDWEPDARPSARDVAELAGALAAEVGGEGLKYWAARAVPPISAEATARAEAMAVGTVMCERGQGSAWMVAPTSVGTGQDRAGEGRLPTRPSLATPAPVRVRVDEVTFGAKRGRRLWPALAAALVFLVPADPVVGITDVTPALQVLHAEQALARSESDEPTPAAAPEPAAPLVEVTPPPPNPTPRVAPAPAPPKAERLVLVALAGDAERVELIGADTYELPAPVPPGAYILRVTFPGQEPYHYNPQQVRAGTRYEVRCLQAVLTCRLMETP